MGEERNKNEGCVRVKRTGGKENGDKHRRSEMGEKLQHKKEERKRKKRRVREGQGRERRKKEKENKTKTKTKQKTTEMAGGRDEVCNLSRNSNFKFV